MNHVTTLEETLHAVVSNRYLVNIVRLAHDHKEQGDVGVDCITDWVAALVAG